MAVKKKSVKKTSVTKKSSASGGAKKKSSAVKKSTVKPKKLSKAKAKKPKKKRKPETLMCFLTTACVRYYNLQDDGYELNTLRHYRDNYLKSTASGKNLVEQYYRISPEIVSHVERDEDKSKVYAFIHNRVLKACEQIDQHKYPSAKRTYKGMVEHLLTRYNLLEQ